MNCSKCKTDKNIETFFKTVLENTTIHYVLKKLNNVLIVDLDTEFLCVKFVLLIIVTII